MGSNVTVSWLAVRVSNVSVGDYNRSVFSTWAFSWSLGATTATAEGSSRSLRASSGSVRASSCSVEHLTGLVGASLLL